MNPSPTPLGLETQEEELGFRSPPPLSAISSLSLTPTPVLMESMDTGKHPTGVRTSGELPTTSEAGSDPRGHLWVTWGVYLWAGQPPWADIILSHPPDLT